MPDEMSTADFRRLWPEVVALQPGKVVFTGGEPLLRPDLLDLMRDLRDADPEHRVLRCLNSNGSCVTPRLAEDLVGLADEVRVSVDALALSNDALRGPGSFDLAMKALETYRAVGFDPKVMVTLTRRSLDELEDLIGYLLEHKYISISINRFRLAGRGLSGPHLALSESEVNHAFKTICSHVLPGVPILPHSEDLDEQSHCGVGRFLNFMPNGDVYPCHVLTQPEYLCGNVRELGLNEICRTTGLIGKLAQMDFRQIAQADERLSSLTRRGACMGEVYMRFPANLVWKKMLFDDRDL